MKCLKWNLSFRYLVLYVAMLANTWMFFSMQHEQQRDLLGAPPPEVAGYHQWWNCSSRWPAPSGLPKILVASYVSRRSAFYQLFLSTLSAVASLSKQSNGNNRLRYELKKWLRHKTCQTLSTNISRRKKLVFQQCRVNINWICYIWPQQ